jgi:predicted Zn-dependent peptidase
VTIRPHIRTRGTHRRTSLALGALLLASLCSAQAVAPLPLTAQRPAASAIDRTAPPPVAATPTLRVPLWTETTLSNGARLVVSPKRDLPLVSVSITFEGGAHQFEPADKVGLASMTAALLAEGTTTRTGEQLSEAQQLLGTTIGASVSDEQGAVAFQALADRFAPALALAVDMMLHPTFPAEALERLRARTLVSLAQAKDQPTVIAGEVFARVLYGAEHPYGRVATEATVKAVTRDDVLAFHRAYYRPARAIVTVTGDVDPAAVKAEVERVFAAWPAGGERASFAYPAVPAAPARTIYLVDKPGAAQSSVVIGLPGPSRDTPDYYALQVLNRILGGHIQSRLSNNIRETRGWSYGVGSGFGYGRGPGAFSAGGEIVTAKTDSALLEFVKELRGVQGGRPFTEDELAEARGALVQGLPRSFASVGALAGAVTTLYLYGLPQDYYQTYAAKINAVTAADLDRVAKRYLDLDRMAIVIVGDRATIETPLRNTGVGPVVVLDAEGKRVPSM